MDIRPKCGVEFGSGRFLDFSGNLPMGSPRKSEKYRKSSGSHLHGWVARRATRRPKGPLKSVPRKSEKYRESSGSHLHGWVARRHATTQRAPKIGREPVEYRGEPTKIRKIPKIVRVPPPSSDFLEILLVFRDFSKPTRDF